MKKRHKPTDKIINFLLTLLTTVTADAIIPS